MRDRAVVCTFCDAIPSFVIEPPHSCKRLEREVVLVLHFGMLIHPFEDHAAAIVNDDHIERRLGHLFCHPESSHIIDGCEVTEDRPIAVAFVA